MGQAFVVVEHRRLTGIAGPMADQATELNRTKVGPRDGMKAIGDAKPRNPGIERQFEIPTGGPAMRGQIRLSQAQPARPVHGVVQRFVLEREYALVGGPRRRSQERKQQAQRDRAVFHLTGFRSQRQPA